MSERDRFDADVAKISEAFLYLAPVHASVARDAADALTRLAKLACEKCGHTAHEPGQCGVNVGTGYHGLVPCRCGLAEDGAARVCPNCGRKIRTETCEACAMPLDGAS